MVLFLSALFTHFQQHLAGIFCDEATCANAHNANVLAHHWAEDCDSFSYEGHKTKNFMLESPFVERGECHRVGAGRPHRGSTMGDHNEDC